MSENNLDKIESFLKGRLYLRELIANIELLKKSAEDYLASTDELESEICAIAKYKPNGD